MMDARDPGAAPAPPPAADPPAATAETQAVGAAKPRSAAGRSATATAARAGKAASTSRAKKAEPKAEKKAEAQAKAPKSAKAAGTAAARKVGKAERAASERTPSVSETTAAPRPRRALTTTMAMASSMLPARARPAGTTTPVAPTCLYQNFFGLQREPFSIAPDPRAMYMSERHREAVAHLLYGVQSGHGGFVVLTGEIGAGKTTVSRCVLEQMPAHVRVALILNPRQNAEELLATICEEFGVKVPEAAEAPAVVAQAGAAQAPGVTEPAPAGEGEAQRDGAPVSDEPVLGLHAIDPSAGPAWTDRVEPPLRRSTKRYVDALGRFLLDSHGRGRHCVLIIDEAQSLGVDVLEQLRLLTNLELHDRKLLQIVLIGQPELRALIATPSMEHLAQRVIARYHLGALTEDETAKYIRHRMTAAGLAGVVPFDELALARIHKLTRGIPRRINLLCDRALLGAWSRGAGVVDVAIVQKAHAEVRGEDDLAGAGPGSARRYAGWLPASWRGSARALAWAAGGIALGLVAVAWYVGRSPG